VIPIDTMTPGDAGQRERCTDGCSARAPSESNRGWRHRRRGPTSTTRPRGPVVEDHVQHHHDEPRRSRRRGPAAEGILADAGRPPSRPSGARNFTGNEPYLSSLAQRRCLPSLVKLPVIWTLPLKLGGLKSGRRLDDPVQLKGFQAGVRRVWPVFLACRREYRTAAKASNLARAPWSSESRTLSTARCSGLIWGGGIRDPSCPSCRPAPRT